MGDCTFISYENIDRKELKAQLDENDDIEL